MVEERAILRYSPNCVEKEFSEVGLSGRPGWMIWRMSERPKRISGAEVDREYLTAPSVIIARGSDDDGPRARQRTVLVFREAEGIYELWELQGGNMLQTEMD